MFFNVDTAAESGEAAVLAYDSVAGHNDGERVALERLAHGASCFRSADALSYPLVSSCFTVRNGSCCFPDRSLERRGVAKIELFVKYDSLAACVLLQALWQVCETV